MARLSVLRPPPPPGRLLPSLASGLAGAAAGFALASWLPVVPSTLLSALLLAGGAGLQRHLRDGGRWWLLVAAACGTFTGTATVLGSALHSTAAEAHWPERALTLVLLAVAGAIAGHSLGRPQPGPASQPRDVLRSASALTTGVFATVVAATYVHLGLDGARAFSSRLSTALTILVIATAGPGWLSHELSRRITARSGHAPPGGGLGHDGPSNRADGHGG